MSNTISRQAVFDALNNIEIPRNASWYQYYQHALTAVDKLPPAQPEIIRCRNCKFASGDSRICMQFGHSPIGELDFLCMGRKEN